jgi:hypothetical protein
MKRITVTSPHGHKHTFMGDTLWIERHGINATVADLRDSAAPKDGEHDQLIAQIPTGWLITVERSA